MSCDDKRERVRLLIADAFGIPRHLVARAVERHSEYYEDLLEDRYAEIWQDDKTATKDLLGNLR